MLVSDVDDDGDNESVTHDGSDVESDGDSCDESFHGGESGENVESDAESGDDYNSGCLFYGSPTNEG